VPDSARYMLAILQDPSTIDGWFILDNGATNVSQEVLLKNQTVYKQLSHIHGDFGNRLVDEQ
jgi:hypothetical protein